MFRSFVITFAVVAMISACNFAPSAGATVDTVQEDSFTISPVVKRGDPRLDGGAFFDFDFCNVNIAGEHGLNDLGQVVISGFVGNSTTGVYDDQETNLRCDVCSCISLPLVATFSCAAEERR